MQRSRMHILDSFDHIYRATRFDFHTGTTYARQCFIRPTRTGIRTGIVGSYSGVRGSVRQQTKKVYLYVSTGTSTEMEYSELDFIR
jgi:hypothetical protein